MDKESEVALTIYSSTLLKTSAQPREKETETHTHIHTESHSPHTHAHTHNLFHAVITLSHPGPPSDINISVIRPKETPAVSKHKLRLEGDLQKESDRK